MRSDLLAALRDMSDELCASLDERASRARADLESGAIALRRAASIDAERRRAAISVTAGRLNALSPLATLARGYAVARDTTSRKTLASVADFKAGAPFTLTLRDGDVAARVADKT